MSKEMKLRFTLYMCATMLAFVFGRYTASFKPQETDATKEIVRNNVVTVTKYIKTPGGTVTRETTVTDHSVKQKDSLHVTVYKPSDWNISLSLSADSFTKPDIYGINIQRRILGPIFVGAQGNTKNQYGLSIGLEF